MNRPAAELKVTLPDEFTHLAEIGVHVADDTPASGGPG